MWACVRSTLAALEEQIFEAPAPRTAEQVEGNVREVFSQDRVQQRLVKQMIEVRTVPRKDHILQGPGEQMDARVSRAGVMEQRAVSSGEVVSLGP